MLTDNPDRSKEIIQSCAETQDQNGTGENGVLEQGGKNQLLVHNNTKEEEASLDHLTQDQNQTGLDNSTLGACIQSQHQAGPSLNYQDQLQPRDPDWVRPILEPSDQQNNLTQLDHLEPNQTQNQNQEGPGPETQAQVQQVPSRAAKPLAPVAPVERHIPRPDPWPTHLRPFTSEAECHLVTHTHHQLQHSDYYWGPMPMEDAHNILEHTPQGTFLIRDSGQPDVFFTLSYRGDSDATSVRVLLNGQHFSLHGSKKSFDSLFALLHFYMSSSRKRLRWPHRRHRPQRLQELCRRRLIDTHGASNIDNLPGLSSGLRDFLHAYPCSI